MCVLFSLAVLRVGCAIFNDGPNIKLVDVFKLVGTGLSLVCCSAILGSTGGFLLLRFLNGVVSHP